MISTSDIETLLEDPKQLCLFIADKLNRHITAASFINNNVNPLRRPTSVLFLLGRHADGDQNPFPKPCFILNKRSQQVRQPGDLCFPGGHIDKQTDRHLASLLKLPGSPLTRWPFWAAWRAHRSIAGKTLSTYLATSLRESFEEMRLNPLSIRFLGPMAPERLVMFYRVIYPMVGWVQQQRRFKLNREVERLVQIPIETFFQRRRYGRYRVSYASSVEKKINRGAYENFPCFIYKTNAHTEVLWGATYRMIERFLKIVFDFNPPDLSTLPVVSARIEGQYLTGAPSLPNKT